MAPGLLTLLPDRPFSIQGRFCETSPYSAIRSSQRVRKAQSMVTGSRQTDYRIQRVVEVLNQDPSRTLQEIAHSCQISASRLSHLFKVEIGINVKNYRLNCRLQVAAAMLVSTGTPIKQIAYTMGYRHTSSFVRAFKSHFGLSPTCYRRSHIHHAA